MEIEAVESDDDVAFWLNSNQNMEKQANDILVWLMVKSWNLKFDKKNSIKLRVTWLSWPW